MPITPDDLMTAGPFETGEAVVSAIRRQRHHRMNNYNRKSHQVLIGLRERRLLGKYLDAMGMTLWERYEFDNSGSNKQYCGDEFEGLLLKILPMRGVIVI